MPDYLAEPVRTLYGSWQGRFRRWTPQELVGLVADQPLDFAPGTGWSYSNTGYILLGLIVQAVTGNPLGKELARRILTPLGLRDTFLPVNFPGMPGPRSRGYSLPLSPPGEVPSGPLLDFTVYNPSLAWAAGALVSDLQDQTRFFRALLGGRLLPPRLLAEMLTTVEVQPGVGYGLGLEVLETPAGRLVGHSGSIPGFDNMVLSTEDGRRQLGLMSNELFASPAVFEAFDQVVAELGMRLLEGTAVGVASTSASVRAAIQAGTPTLAARATWNVAPASILGTGDTV